MAAMVGDRFKSILTGRYYEVVAVPDLLTVYLKHVGSVTNSGLVVPVIDLYSRYEKID